jgi:TonB-dependent starch-binding outer membrane protein SusC
MQLLFNACSRGRGVTKTLLIMQLTAIFLFAAVLQVSASGMAQTVTYAAKSESITKVFTAIKQQTGYAIIYRKEDVKNSRPVTVTLQNADIKTAIEAVLKNQELKYEIEGNTIVIGKDADKDHGFNKKVFNPSLTLTSPPITGIIKGPDGQPIAGVNIVVKGTKRGTTTNIDGSFTIDAKAGEKLIISNIGYIEKELIVTTDNLGEINLNVNNTELKEVIISKGYYNTTKELNTGSVSTIADKDISKQPVNDFGMALQGRIAGLSIVQLTGVPGASLRINLRGINSIANGNEPLFVINGIPFPSRSMSQMSNSTGAVPLSPLNSIRPENIESITVLKDADATAIYGSRGANGVILIKTKQGSIGVTKVDFNIYHSVSKVPQIIKLMNGDQYISMRNEAFKNDNATPQSYDSDVNGDWSKTKYTDWQKVMIGNAAYTTQAQATVSGGTQLTQFLLGTSFRNENTVFPGEYPSRLASVNLNLNHRSENNKFFTSFTSNYNYSNYKLPINDFSSYIYMAPNAPDLYDAEGNINWENNTFQNPMANLLQSSKSVTDNIISNLTLSYKLFENLEIKATTGYNFTKLDESLIVPYTSVMPSPFDDPAIFRGFFKGDANIRTWNIEPQINFNKNWRNHSLEALVATTFQSTQSQRTSIDASGYPSDALIENPVFATTKQVSASYTQYRYDAVFARLGYNYAGKYVLNLTGRRDGSSRFGPSNRYGNFGAIGAAWIFTKEKFIKNSISFLSSGKIRGSIGKTGNDQFADYQYLSTYTSNGANFGGSVGLLPSRLTNPNYGWESITKIEASIELGLMNDRIIVNANYFRNRTHDQLVGYSLPYTTGFNRVTANLPAVIQNRGIELELRSINIDLKNFNWNTAFNVTIPRNKLVSFPNIAGTSYSQIYAVGQPLGIFFLYQYTGVDKTTGLYSFEDLNKDGFISSLDDRRPHFIGQDFFGGLSNTLTYKGLSLDVFLQFVKKNGRKYIGNAPPGIFLFTGANQPISALNRWQKVGDIADVQKYNQDYSAIDAYDNYTRSTGILTDASFVRVKNVMLSYKFDPAWIKRFNVRNFTLYLQLQNILTITKYKYADPEASGGGIPPSRTIAFGTNLSF